MKCPIFFLVLTFCSYCVLAQEYQVSGSVENTESAPMIYANVLLLKSIDSTVLKGTSTDEKGKFYIDGVTEGKYLLVASYIKNTSEYLSIDVTNDTKIITLIINEAAENLDEVVVTQRKPILERKVDRLVFNVENTALSDETIWDLLKHTPSVREIQGVLAVRGSSDITVMINERKINLPKSDIINLLAGSSANNVESVEVITNPPAKYSAEGGMLINIKMKKNLIAGYNGSIYNRYTQGVFAKHTLGTDHFFKGKKTAFSINYTYGRNKQLNRYTDITNFFEEENTTSTWTAEQDYIRWQKPHNVSVFFDYDIDQRNTINLSSINLWNPNFKKLFDTETIITSTDNQLLSSFSTVNNSDQEQLNTSYYLDYVHKLKKDGSEISINTHYTYYYYNRGQALETDFFDGEGTTIGDNNFTTKSDQLINLYSAQLDYLSPLDKNSRMETGLRYAGIASKSNITQQGFDRTQAGINPTEAANFTYDEDIFAAYASYSAKWDKWTIKSGLRAEFTKTMGILDSDVEANKNEYLEWFPSFSTKYTLNSEHDFNLYYYRRLSRPRYNKINPFQVFLSNNAVIEGNPKLLPATRNYISGGYTFDRSYTVEFFYRNEKNPIRELAFQDNNANLLRYINTNLVRNISYGIDLTVDKSFTNYWDYYFFFSLFEGKYKFEDLDSGQPILNAQWSWFVRNSNSFTFLDDKSLYLFLDFNYYSAATRGNSIREAYSELGISLRKTLWDKKASISMGLSDIFNQGNIFNTREFLNQSNTELYRPENRLFTLGFRYKFGNTGIKTNKKRKRVEERRRI